MISRVVVQKLCTAQKYNFVPIISRFAPSLSFTGNEENVCLKTSKCFYSTEKDEPTIPPYEDKIGEPIHLKRARLLYQSRKRGMLENGLILSTFAHKYLDGMSEKELIIYDRLINLPSNDWEIYYWATGVKPTPEEFDTAIMHKLQDFVKNEKRENRTRQPDLKELNR